MKADRSHELRFESLAEAARWFSRLTAEGAVEVGLPGAREGDELWLRLEVSGEGTFGAHARVLSADGAGRARCSVRPRADFQELLARHALRRRSGRIAPADPRREHPRFDTCLKARFRSFQQLISEYVFNLSAGGMFLRCAEPPAVGTALDVEVTFPDGARHQVCAEVVWRVEADPESPERAPGAGVRFLEPGPFQLALEQLLTGYLARSPRVLLVDDDPFFLRVLADGLLARGMEVATAENGLRASHLISELLYDLDLVVLDLEMPFLDGRALLERLRRLGCEMDLRVVLVSAADPEELAALVGPEGADAAFPKSLGVPEVLEKLVGLTRRG